MGLQATLSPDKGMARWGAQSGFTIIELIVVIVITGILSTVFIQLIVVPVDSYVDVSRRARLVDMADNAIQRMVYDIKLALPNSIRVGCDPDNDGEGQCVEYLNAVAGARYRAGPPGDRLKFNSADQRFEVMGSLDISSIDKSTNLATENCANNGAACVVVYNTGQTGSDAWNFDNMVTLLDTGSSSSSTTPSWSPAIIRFDNTAFAGGGNRFPFASPQQRFYIVDTPVKYICDLSAQTLRRYQGYNIVTNEASVDSHAELVALSNSAESGLLAENVTACSFSYDPGTASRNAVLKISITVTESSENVRLLQQVSVDNLP